MRNLTVTMNMSLDGVVQAPGRPDEDTRDGFDRGGWAVPYGDDVMAEKMGSGMASSGAMVFGRRTYLDFAGYWPHQADNPFTPFLNAVHKYVVSNTLTEPLPWQNSSLLSGDAASVIAELKAQDGPDLAIVGSAALVRSLFVASLIDQFVLLIHPLVLGKGHRLFDQQADSADLELIDSVTTSTGVIIATYRSRLSQEHGSHSSSSA
jgi:dihydrofolate reductase